MAAHAPRSFLIIALSSPSIVRCLRFPGLCDGRPWGVEPSRSLDTSGRRSGARLETTQVRREVRSECRSEDSAPHSEFEESRYLHGGRQPRNDVNRQLRRACGTNRAPSKSERPLPNEIPSNHRSGFRAAVPKRPPHRPPIRTASKAGPARSTRPHNRFPNLAQPIPAVSRRSSRNAGRFL